MVREEDEERFAVAFVVFVMSCVLAPGAMFDYASVDYWSALADAKMIGQYDWAGYVLEKMMEGVLRLKADLVKRTRVPNLVGCSLFLQILYLDSVNLGSWNLPHDVLPRVRVFSFDRIRSMIAADSYPSDASMGDSEFGNSSLRIPDGICYKWARESVVRTKRFRSPEDHQGLISEGIMGKAQRFQIPPKALRPVCMVYHELRRQLFSRLEADASRFLSAAISIIGPYASGFSYDPEPASDPPTYEGMLVPAMRPDGS
ncbi:hypothetical protein ACP4OV_013619 [Aristida adscensionis]